MKHYALLLIFGLLSLNVLAQAPEGMVKIDVTEESTDQAYASYVAARSEATGLRTVPDILVRETSKNNVIVNEEILLTLLKEFYDGSIHYKADYGPELYKLKQVIFVDTEDYGFLGSVSKDGSTVTLNSSLLQYPNLARVIFLHQMGKLYGVPEASEFAHDIMSPHWFIDQDHEDLAERLRTRPEQREHFFEALAKKNPLRKRI